MELSPADKAVPALQLIGLQDKQAAAFQHAAHLLRPCVDNAGADKDAVLLNQVVDVRGQCDNHVGNDIRRHHVVPAAQLLLEAAVPQHVAGQHCVPAPVHAVGAASSQSGMTMRRPPISSGL